MSLHATSRERKMFYCNIRMLRCGGGEVKEKVGDKEECVPEDDLACV
jgi:hypothetical protein